MKLNKMLEGLNVDITGNTDIEIKGITYDSRKVKEGWLFIAITGFETDGHKFIENAIESGAAAIIGEKDIKCSSTYIKTENSRRLMALVSAAFYNHPEKKLKIIGLTGTNGKTTTAYLIRQILKLKGMRCDLIGTNQIIIGNEETDSTRTTPESLDLFETLYKMEKSGGEYVVMEVSSHSLVLDRVYGIKFETAVLTNITQDHLDFHKTMENYAAAKSILFSMSKTSSVNADSDYKDIILKKAGKSAKTYSIDSNADVRAENIKMSERGVIFTLVKKSEKREMRLGIPGRFSVYNALAAITACENIGIADEDIEKGLVLAKPVKGRIEVVHVNTPYTIIIDYAHTPDGMKNIISAVRGFAKRRVITLFGCGGDRDASKRPIMGKIAEDLSDTVIVTSDNPRTEAPSDIIKDILAGMTKDNHTVIENRRDAIKEAMQLACEGDIIILAGKGHETYQEINHVKHHFDEREIVRDILSLNKGNE